MLGLSPFRRWWTARILRRERIPSALWQRLVERLPLLTPLNGEERERLRDLASLFLHEKVIVGAGGFEPDEFVRGSIAAQASLLILNLGLEYFGGWREIIVYPDTFVARRQEMDEAGVVHETRKALDGEAWGQGPVILAWADVEAGLRTALAPQWVVNVVLHEFAHKIDFLDGADNGLPPLHAEMVQQRWAEVFTHAFQNLCRQVDAELQTAIDPYAAESPAEFFAVATEYFFAAPRQLADAYPEVYEQLRLFYRQDPLSRRAATAAPGAVT